MELKILPRNIADMIAAGEVVQRPSSVVKELMENAIDAGATDVKVVITDSGRTLIQVIDNGCGMTPDDAVLCFERHATSKLQSAEDLHHILTFGFRGEALASIAAVAEVTLRTRREGDSVGSEVVIAGSEVKSVREVATPQGCNFCVRNLFYNIPARRKFLKSDTVEFRHIVEEFQRIAITRPGVAFSLTHNGRDIHVVKPAQSLKFRIQDLLGAALVGEIMDIGANTSVCSLSGFVGKPESARKTLGNQFMFVNGRYFRSPYLHKAVMKAYEDVITEGATPSYFIFLAMDPASMDVNIHPTKTEIKFEEEQMLFQTIQGAVREAMGRNSIGGDIDFDNPEAVQMPVFTKEFQEFHPATYNPFDPYSAHVDKAPAEDYGVLFQEKTMPSTQVMTIQGRYILSQSASGLMAIHVKRARERLLFERFAKALENNVHVTQASLFPVQVTVGTEGVLLLQEYASLLESLGFDIAPFGTDTVVLNGVPEGFSTEAGKAEELLRNVLLLLEDNGSSLPEAMARETARKFAMLGASSAPAITSSFEAQRLVDALLQLDNPEFTPGGRRVISLISIDELEKRF